VELVNAGDAGSVGVTVTGKNLFDYNTFKNNGNYYRFPVSPGKKLYRNSGCGQQYLWELYDEEGNRLGTFSSLSFSASNPLTLPSNASYIATTDAGVNSDMYVGYHSDTTYEPYNAQTLAIQKPSTDSVFLPGIPVDSGGNYTDENGQQWICDEWNPQTGEYIRRIQRAKFSSTVFSQETLSNGIKSFYINLEREGLPAPRGSMYRAFCNYLPWKSPPGTDVGVFYISAAGYLNMRPPEHLQNMTMAEFNALKAENPIWLLYARKTPVVETLNMTAEELAQLAALHTNYPNTTIFNDVGAVMEVKYVADTKLYIDKKFDQLAQAMLNQ
jgi:hypothetical protein